MSFKRWLSRNDKSNKKKSAQEDNKVTVNDCSTRVYNVKKEDLVDTRIRSPPPVENKLLATAVAAASTKGGNTQNPFVNETSEEHSHSPPQSHFRSDSGYNSNYSGHTLESLPKPVFDSDDGDLESVFQNYPAIRPHATVLFPYGDGSNKVFGYENFGNTCYCNSVLQCLYSLPELRVNMLQYPERPPNLQRRRKSRTPGVKPRVFDETSFGPTSSTPTNGGANPATNSNSKNPSTSSGSSNSLTKETPKKNSLIFFKDKELPKSPTSSQNGHSPPAANNVPPAAAPVHVVVMASDAITEKLHEGYTRVVVGRTNSTPSKDNGPHHTKNSSSSASLSPPPSNSPSSHSDLSVKQNEPSSDQRKKAALLKGPVLNVDHSCVDCLPPNSAPNLYSELKHIFECIAENNSLTGVVSPIQFVDTLKKENVLFNTMMHQDAHEFLNFLLNELSDSLKRPSDNDNAHQATNKNFIEGLFKGTMTNRTKCLTCDNLTYRNEPFLDFPIEVQEDAETDIQMTLSDFHQKEMLNGSNKFYCDECCGLQEAERVVGLKQLPFYLALHLKRFKYSEEQNCNIKLFNKIHYPAYLKVCSTFDSSVCKQYELVGVIVHMGGGPHHGHYVSLCKHENFGWLLFDDETVEAVTESTVLKFIGDSDDLTTAYVLFYKDMSGNLTSEKEPSTQQQYAENVDELIKADERIRRKGSKATIVDHSCALEEVPEERMANTKSLPKQARRKSRLFSFKRSSKD